MDEISLVIFTCEGREHLLHKTYESFMHSQNQKFSKIILAIDGQIDPSVISLINPTLIIQSPTRMGYVRSILNTLANITTPYFFWLEDDFIFLQEIPFEKMITNLVKMQDWAGIFLSRTAPLTALEKQVHHFDDFYIPDFKYSVSPTLCRTAYIKQAFNEMLGLSNDEESRIYGFENYLSDYFSANNISYALLDPGEKAHLRHFGQLESTDRKYHMINSLSESQTPAGNEYISGFGNHKKITIKNKLNIFFKLWYSILLLSIKLFKNREAYDFAFRIYISKINGFKE